MESGGEVYVFACNINCGEILGESGAGHRGRCVERERGDVEVYAKHLSLYDIVYDFERD